MKGILSSIIIVLFYAGCAGKDTGPVVLVRNGQPTSVIVIADSPADAAKQGATDIQMWLKKITGATVPIKPEREVPDKTEEALILVGDSRRTQSLGIDSETFDLEEIFIKTFPGTLVIIGDDERPDGFKLNGTLLAASTFVDEILGVHLLWPGKFGEVVPKRTSVEVTGVDLRYRPILRQRKMSRVLPGKRQFRYFGELGWDRDTYRSIRIEESSPWFHFHRMGESFRARYGHAYSKYWERFHEEHPEWFALQPDGTRDNSKYRPQRLRLCVSNRELIEHIAGECIERFKRDPTSDTVSISPNDDGGGTICFCEKCEAMDATDGRMVTTYGPDGPIPHVSLTDRYVKFFSAIAEIVSEEFPDHYLCACAYHEHSLPPVHAKLHPNVIIGLTIDPPTYLNDDKREEMHEAWLKWSETASKVFIYSNAFMAGHNFPTIYVHRLGEDMRFFADNKLLLFYNDCCFNHWSTNGLNYYVTAKLNWDPYCDVDEVVNEYCRAGFGKAAVHVRAYFDKLEEITTDIAGGRDYLDVFSVAHNPEVIAQHYPDDVIEGLNALLDSAESLSGDDETIRGRIEFLRTGLDYVPISRDYILAKAKDSHAKLAEAKEKRIEWFRKTGYTWALDIPTLMCYDF